MMNLGKIPNTLSWLRGEGLSSSGKKICNLRVLPKWVCLGRFLHLTCLPKQAIPFPSGSYCFSSPKDGASGSPCLPFKSQLLTCNSTSTYLFSALSWGSTLRIVGNDLFLGLLDVLQKSPSILDTWRGVWGAQSAGIFLQLEATQLSSATHLPESYTSASCG